MIAANAEGGVKQISLAQLFDRVPCGRTLVLQGCSPVVRKKSDPGLKNRFFTRDFLKPVFMMQTVENRCRHNAAIVWNAMSLKLKFSLRRSSVGHTRSQAGMWARPIVMFHPRSERLSNVSLVHGNDENPDSLDALSQSVVRNRNWPAAICTASSRPTALTP